MTPLHVTGYEFRPATREDRPAMTRIAKDHDATVIAIIPEEALVACRENVVVGYSAASWFDDDRISLSACVAAEHAPALLETLLRSAEEQGRRIATGSSAWLRIDRALIPNGSVPAETMDVYERCGFNLVYVEHELAAPPTGAPLRRSLEGIQLVAWTAERHELIRETYNEAFRDRGFEGYSAESWDRRLSDEEFFRAEFSFVADAAEQIVGFVLCWAFHHSGEPAWIDTLGVRPAYRGRGVATALMLRAMAAMRDAGFERVALRVNEDNALARRLYEKLGFETVKKHVVYRKRL